MSEDLPTPPLPAAPPLPTPSPPPTVSAGAPPVITEPASGSPGAVMTDGKFCYKCGYALTGLPLAGHCPECGMPVADSLRGILLQFASPEYIRTVRTGHSWVLTGILVSIVMMLGTIGATVATTYAGMTAVSGPALSLLAQGATSLVGVAILLGYLKLTEPDPQFTGTEKADSARNVVRVAAMAQIGLSAASFALVAVNGGTPKAITTLTGLLSVLVGFASMAAWATQFFAMMMYTGWLARRVPDRYIIRRTKTYMWLLPVLTTVGVVLIGLGPLIALVMYWNLLDRMRKHLKSIEATGVPAVLPNMAG